MTRDKIQAEAAALIERWFPDTGFDAEQIAEMTALFAAGVALGSASADAAEVARNLSEDLIEASRQ